MVFLPRCFSAISGVSGQNRARSPYEDKGQLCPIFFIPIDKKANLGIFQNVANPAQPSGVPFGFAVNGSVDAPFFNDEDHRHHVRSGFAVRCGKMTDTCTLQEAQDVLCQEAFHRLGQNDKIDFRLSEMAWVRFGKEHKDSSRAR